MKLIRHLFLACLVCLMVLASVIAGSIGVLSAQIQTGGSLGSYAQVAAPNPPTPPRPQSAPSRDLEQRFQGFEERRYLGPVFRLGVPYVLNAGSEVSEVAVVFGDATINGRVDGNVAVVLGNLRLGATAIVSGSVVNIGGTATIADGAAISDDLVVIAGSLDAPPGFSPLGQHVLIGPPALGDSLRGVVPWFTQGLLWGRVIVPSLSWMWPLIGISLLIFLVIAGVFPTAVRACAATLAARPLSSFFAGILTLLLIGPICAVLAVSVVGVIVIPFALCAVVIGWVVGKVGVADWIGGGLIRGGDPDSRGSSLLTMFVGFVLITVTYMVPGLGLAAWALVGLLGVGTATLTFFGAIKRERPEPKPKPTPPVAPPPAPPADVDLPLTGGAPIGAPLSSSAQFSSNAPAAAAYATADTAGLGGGASPSAAATIGADSSYPQAAGDLRAYPRATFLDRLGAAALDFILLIVAKNFLDWRDDDGVFFLLALAYFAAFIAWKGTTIGGIVCSLRVIRTDGQPVRPVDSVVRALSSLFSIAALGIGFFWILLAGNRDRQAWHDKIAGTLVIRVPRDFPI